MLPTMVGEGRKFLTLDHLKLPETTFLLPFYLAEQNQILYVIKEDLKN